MSRRPLFFLFLLLWSPACVQQGGEGITTDTELQSPVSTARTSDAGVPIPVKIRQIDTDTLARPRIVPLKSPPRVSTAYPNIQAAGTPEVVIIPENLPVIIPGENGIPLPETFAVQGKKVMARQPEAHTALMPQMNDNAAYDIRYWDVEQGMSASIVGCMLEDSRGDLWFGTILGGISRFDGHSFFHYRKEEGLVTTETDFGYNTVTTIVEDSRGNIWVGTRGGLGCYNGHYFTHYTTEEGLPHAYVWAILEDSQGNMWFGTNGGACRYDGQSFTTYTTEQGLVHNMVQCMVEDSRGDIWFGTRGGLSRFRPDEAQGSFTSYTVSEGLSDLRVSTAVEDSRGHIWFGTKGGINRYDPGAGGRRGSFTHYTTEEGLSNDDVLSVLEDSRGDMWLGTFGGGVNQYDGRSFTHYTTKEGLSEDIVSAILEDRQGNMWFATGTAGVNRYKRNSFRFFTADEGFSDAGVRQIMEDRRGNIWIGTMGDGVICYQEDSLGMQSANFVHYTSRQGLSKDYIQSVAEDREGSLWFGSTGSVARYDGYRLSAPQHRFAHFTGEQGLENFAGWGMLENRKGDMLFGTFNGLYRYDGRYFTHYSLREKLPNDGIGPMLEDRQGHVWFSTFSGLIQYDPVQGAGFTYYNTDQGLSYERVLCLGQDSRGNKWFGTPAGLDRYHPAPEDDSISTGNDRAGFAHYTAEDGLADNYILSIQEDRQGNLWISSQLGITMLRPADENEARSSDYDFVTFGKADGLNKLNFVGTSVCLDSRNRIWWGADHGLTMLDLNTFKLDAVPQARISDIELLQNKVDYRRLSDTAYSSTLPFGTALLEAFDSVTAFFNYPIAPTFPYDIDHLTFHFSAIDWSAPHRVQYSYLLEGLEDRWSPAQSTNTADYRNLPPGNYTLKVKAKSMAGVWGEPFEYPFTIAPPWWQTLWAYGIYALLVAFSLWLLVRWRTSVQRRKLAEARQLNDRLQQVDQLKDQFLANTSHELRTPLHGMIGLAESLVEEVDKEDQKDNLRVLIASGKRLSSLVNDLLDFSRVKNHDLHLAQKPVGLRPLVEVILQACTPLLGAKPIELQNRVPEKLPAVYADEDRLQQILFNLIGNAIKFTQRGYVAVGAAVEGDMVRVAVEDTGIGVPAGKQEAIFQAFEQADGSSVRQFGGTGLGLAITRQLVELHGGRIWVESPPKNGRGADAEGKGARFYFTLPISTKAVVVRTAAEVTGESGRPILFEGLQFSNTPKTEISLAATDQEAVRILLVDDEPVNHQVIRNYLKADHIQLVSALNGQEALDLLQRSAPDNGYHGFDLVLLDVMMPHMSGYEVCRQIRECYLPSEMPVIMVTAKGQIADLIQGLETGANDYIAKPFSKDEFLARIKTHLNLHRINTATSRFVPSDFLRTIGRSTITEVRRGDQQYLDVTVLFTDIRSYTTLAEGMTPEENFKFVNAYAGRMGPIIRRHRGFVNQYLGDGIMAIFQHHPDDALQAAVEMQQMIRQYNEQRLDQGRQAISVGMGLHTGPLVMGIIGDDLRNDAATIADTVNTASRVEDLTKYYGANILLTDESMRQVKTMSAISSFRYLGQVLVKGKNEPVGIYECFEGDLPHLKEAKLRTADDFEKALRYYLDRNFPKAVEVFNHILMDNPADQPARLLLSKASKYLIEGVPDDWTGVEVISSK